MNTRSAILLRAALLWVVLIALGGMPGLAQQQVLLAEDSRLWIEGRTNISGFTCEARQLEGEGVLAGGAALRGNTALIPGLPALRRHVARLVVPVASFDCGKDGMNADLYKALKGKAFPEIVFELSEARVARPPEDSLFAIYVEGRLRIAGVENPITLTATAWRDAQGRYRARGVYPLNMRDYGIDPPSALLGLVKVRDQIEVHFDLVAVPDISLNNTLSR